MDNRQNQKLPSFSQIQPPSTTAPTPVSDDPSSIPIPTPLHLHPPPQFRPDHRFCHPPYHVPQIPSLPEPTPPPPPPPTYNPPYQIPLPSAPTTTTTPLPYTHYRPPNPIPPEPSIAKPKKLHREVEQKRRMRMAEQILELRKWVSNPNGGKTDKVSVLQDAVTFVKQAAKRIDDLRTALERSQAECESLRAMLAERDVGHPSASARPVAGVAMGAAHVRREEMGGGSGRPFVGFGGGMGVVSTGFVVQQTGPGSAGGGTGHGSGAGRAGAFLEGGDAGKRENVFERGFYVGRAEGEGGAGGAARRTGEEGKR